MNKIIINNNNKAKRREGIIFTLTGVPLVVFTMLSYILYRKIKLNFPAELVNLNLQYYHIIKPLLLLPTILFMLSFFILESFIGAGKEPSEHVQFHKIDYERVLQELFRPTQQKYRIRRIVLIIFSTLSFVVLFASQIFFYASI
ncbi:MAG: hypothetical protein ACTSYW_00175 [Candidatus Heimdallarchaeota archaeon]